MTCLPLRKCSTNGKRRRKCGSFSWMGLGRLTSLCSQPPKFGLGSTPASTHTVSKMMPVCLRKIPSFELVLYGRGLKLRWGVQKAWDLTVALWTPG